MVGKRGLGGTDQQMFQMTISETFRNTFDKIYSLLLNEVCSLAGNDNN